jgi:hypothetical protein
MAKMPYCRCASDCRRAARAAAPGLPPGMPGAWSPACAWNGARRSMMTEALAAAEVRVKEPILFGDVRDLGPRFVPANEVG